MPRRREIAKREVPADPIYNSPLVTKFISTIMSSGKRSTAERIMYKAMDIVNETMKQYEDWSGTPILGSKVPNVYDKAPNKFEPPPLPAAPPPQKK